MYSMNKQKECESCGKKLYGAGQEWKKLCYGCYTKQKIQEEEDYEIAKAESKWEEATRQMVVGQNRRED